MTATADAGPAEYRGLPGPGVDALLVDGDVVVIRALQSDDQDALIELHRRTDADNLRLRFFTANPSAGEEYAVGLFDRLERVIALVAVRHGVLIGVAAAEPVRPDAAEVAFLVDPAAHGLGIGTLLLEHLAAAARNRGIDRFVAEVLAENGPMIKVFADAGFGYRRTIESGVISLELDTVASANAVSAADARECRAEARSLAPLLGPRSVAIVGIRRDGTGVGHAVLQSIRHGGYTGSVRIVHPQAPMIDGIRADRDFESIPGPVDLAIIAVPAERVLPVITEAAESGVRAAVVLASGFSELSESGRSLQHELVRIARRYGMRIVGPNCLGVIIGDPTLRLNATFVDRLPPAGGLAIASQSGGVGIALIDAATRTGIGVQSFLSLGNKADVSGNDLLGAWMDDDRVTAAALYLESFGNARKFARLARRFTERKPLLAVIGGRSAGGRRAGASHTAAAAPPAIGVQALFAQAGVIDCRDLDELADTACLLQNQPLPAGLRVGIVSNAGGLGVLAADAAATNGLLVPELSADLRQLVASGLGAGQSVMAASSLGNPVDLGAGATADGFVAAARAVAGSGEVDAVLMILAGTAVTDARAVLAGLDDPDHAAEDLRVPRVLVGYGPGTDVDRVVSGSGAGYLRLRSAGAALAALGHAARYREWRDGGGGELPAEDRARAERVRRTAAAEFGESQQAERDGWLAPDAAGRLLGAYGVPVTSGTVVTGVDAVVAAADRIGYPVVIKAADPAVVHKSDRGLVRTGLNSANAAREAAMAMLTELGDGPPGHDALLVQPQIPTGGIELAYGIVRDPSFGPLVMVAAGGVAIDVWADRVFLMPPFGRGEAARAIRRLRIWPLLAGYRGTPPADIDGLEELLLGLGRLSTELPELAELDLNPVIALAAGTSRPIACVDVKLRLAAVQGPVVDSAPGLSPS